MTGASPTPPTVKMLPSTAGGPTIESSLPPAELVSLVPLTETVVPPLEAGSELNATPNAISAIKFGSPGMAGASNVSVFVIELCEPKPPSRIRTVDRGKAVSE